MLKKLQNLLFEDDEIDEEEEEEVEEEVEEVKPAKKKRGRHRKEEEEEEVYEEPIPQPSYQAKVEPAPAPAPVQKPVLKRVEVTQAISVPKPEPVQEAPAFNNNAAFQRPSAPVQHASPRPISTSRPVEPAPAFNIPTPQQSSFGISADDSAVKPADHRAQTNRHQEIKRPTSTVYEFRPVISPMFGVDEKDINMMSYSAKNEPQPELNQARATSQVLSPIYGADQETTPAANEKEKVEIPSFDGSAYQPQPQPDENTFPEFSLDDILSARDEEFNRQNVFDTNQEYRTPDIDETAVIDSNQYSPYDQQTLDFNRKR